MRMVRVRENTTLVRDPESGAILTEANSEYEKFKKNKLISKHKQEEAEAKEERLNKLENDVANLKTGISQILEILKK